MATLIMLVLNFVLIAIAIYFLAMLDVFFTTMKEPTIKAVVDIGGKWVRFIVTVPGYHHNDSTRKLVKDEDDLTGARKLHGFTELTGLHWVGIWPFRRILRIKITKQKLRRNRDEIPQIEKKILTIPATVDHLRWVIKRPVVVLNVDFVDGTVVNMLYEGLFEVVDPYRIMFELDDFFGYLAGQFSGCTQAYHKSRTYDEFREQREMDISLMNEISVSGVPNQFYFPEVVGLKARTMNLIDFDLSPADKAMKDSLQQVRIAERAGDARVAAAERDKRARVLTGEGEASYIRATGSAQGERLEKLVSSLMAIQGMSRAEALSLVETQVRNENLAQLKGTLVEGGARRVGVNISEEKR